MNKEKMMYKVVLMGLSVVIMFGGCASYSLKEFNKDLKGANEALGGKKQQVAGDGTIATKVKQQKSPTPLSSVERGQVLTCGIRDMNVKYKAYCYNGEGGEWFIPYGKLMSEYNILHTGEKKEVPYNLTTDRNFLMYYYLTVQKR